VTAPALIAQHPLLKGLPASYLATIAECGADATFPKGAALYREGQEQRCFYLIRDGSVALQTAAPDRDPSTFMTLHSGDFVGVSWLAPPFRCSFDAIATSFVRAAAFDASCLRGKCDADPALGYALMQRFIPALIERMTCARLQALDLYGVTA